MSQSKVLIIGSALLVGVFLLDIFSKNTFFNAIPERTAFSSYIAITHHENHGAIANIQISIATLIIASLIVIIFIALAILGMSDNRVIGLALIEAGALGNLVDRFRFGYVRDWLLLFDRSAINLADIAISVGVLLLFVFQRKISKSKLRDRCKTHFCHPSAVPAGRQESWDPPKFG